MKTEQDVEEVERIVAAQNRIAAEVQRRRDLPARIAAVRDAQPAPLPEDTRSKPRERLRTPMTSWVGYQVRG